MILVIAGLIVFVIAVVVAVAGVVTNAGRPHLATDHFAVLGYHVTGSTGTVFLYGILVGIVAMLGVSVLLTGARRSAVRGHQARQELKQLRKQSTPTTVDTHEHPTAGNTTHDNTPADGIGDTPATHAPNARRRSWFDPRTHHP